MIEKMFKKYSIHIKQQYGQFEAFVAGGNIVCSDRINDARLKAVIAYEEQRLGVKLQWLGKIGQWQMTKGDKTTTGLDLDEMKRTLERKAQVKMRDSRSGRELPLFCMDKPVVGLSVAADRIIAEVE